MTAKQPACWQKRHTALVVDDEVGLAEMMREILIGEGLDVTVAHSGEEALERLDEQVPCLALLDILMPGMSGLELCRRIKQGAGTAHVPVLLVSSLVSAAEVAEGLAAGADDYIRKPIDRAIVRFRVRSHIRLHEAHLEEQRLRDRISVISEAARDAIILMDGSGRVAHWNEAAESLLGYRREEALGRDLHDLIAPARYRPAQLAATPGFRSTGIGCAVGQTLELTARTKDGCELPVELSLSATTVDGEYWAVGILRDISARKQSEERFRLMFEGSRDALLMMGPPEWRFDTGNPAAVALFGAANEADLTSRGPWEYSPPTQPNGLTSAEAARVRIEEVLANGSASFDWMHRTLGGVDFAAQVLLTRLSLDGEERLLVTVRDVTAEQHLQTELNHARKLEAVGQLAAGIAHEINTPVQYLSDSVHFQKDVFDTLLRLVPLYRAATSLAPDSGPAQSAALIEEESDLDFLLENTPGSLDRCFDGLSRVTSIVRAMKEFAHPDEREMAAADLNRAIESTLTIARHEYKYVADIVTELGDIPFVECHVGDLNQVFLNLIVNAAHAVADVVGDHGTKGTIRIRTWREDDRVAISIADSGTGIPEAIRHKVFEPFFTTKPVGQGSGQGLAIARAIVVERHHGDLRFDSAPGAGTTFYIRLPIVALPAEPEPQA